ncbi:GntR family transcriptional regulator [Kordiimonas aquimaris]|uniref:GntR family transcriptional regulator n=1 Tax=Kordiimonas aquimaris TaxID=707591 RepID=UPI0021D275BF|nr:GntR family transcriptional regulator [Kordiimonas aquimaris]
MNKFLCTKNSIVLICTIVKQYKKIYLIYMEIEINMSSPTPVYEQIVQQVQQGVQNGALNAGDNLPAIRQLANDLGLNQNTVAKAYKLLEQQHVTVNRGRKGTCVRDSAAQNIMQNNSHNAAIQLQTLIQSFRLHGMSAEDVCALLEIQITHLKE